MTDSPLYTLTDAVNVATVNAKDLAGQKIPISQKAAPLGVATLGSDGKVPTAQLPPEAGLGNMLSSANLSDLASIPTAKANLGLNNVDNTSDINKPISTAVQTALNAKAGNADIKFKSVTVANVSADYPAAFILPANAVITGYSLKNLTATAQDAADVNISIGAVIIAGASAPGNAYFIAAVNNSDVFSIPKNVDITATVWQSSFDVKITYAVLD